MEQLFPWLIFCTAVSTLCLIRPYAARIFVGVFFAVMAVGVNVVLAVVAPDQFLKLGAAPLIPFYAWFFHYLVAAAPQVIGMLAAAGELAVALLILSGGRRTKLGLAGAIVFLIIITPLGIWTLPNPVLAAGLAWLTTKEYPKSSFRLSRPSHQTPTGEPAHRRPNGQKLTVTLEDVGGSSWWASILTTLGSQYGNTQLRYVGQVDGKTRYKSPTFPTARLVRAVPPQEEWAPGMAAALAELKRDLARDGWVQDPEERDPRSLTYNRE